jgi:hypothetical protein
MKRVLAPAALLLLLAVRTPAEANPAIFPGTGLRVREVAPPNAVAFELVPCQPGQGPRLVVPRRCLDRAKAVENPESARAAAPLLPAAAVVSLGLCLALGLTRGRRSVLAVLALAAVLGGGGYILNAEANAPAPPPTWDHPQQASNPPVPANLTLDDVPVEITDDGDTVRLLVPRDRLAELSATLRH